MTHLPFYDFNSNTLAHSDSLALLLLMVHLPILALSSALVRFGHLKKST